MFTFFTNYFKIIYKFEDTLNKNALNLLFILFGMIYVTVLIIRPILFKWI